MPINENQLQVVQRYLDLLETIDEAFRHVKNQPLIQQVRAAELMYPDILRGWEKLSETHKLIHTYFQDDNEVMGSMEAFNTLIEQWELEMPAAHQSEKLTHMLIRNLGPRYANWKNGMQGALQKMVVH